MRHIIITIGRQSGSGGRKIGELLAEKLGIPCYGKSELQKIAEGTDDYEEVQSFYEEEPVNSLLYAIAMSQFEQEVGRIPFRRIRELASKESCIIIGRCAGHIFREDPEAVRVFIHADPKIRVQRIMEREGLSETKAKKFLEDTDSRRASFHKYYTKQEWGLAQDYELCLDSGVLGIEVDPERFTAGFAEVLVGNIAVEQNNIACRGCFDAVFLKNAASSIDYQHEKKAVIIISLQVIPGFVMKMSDTDGVEK